MKKLKFILIITLLTASLQLFSGCGITEKIASLDNINVNVMDTTSISGSTILEQLLGDIGFDNLTEFNVESSEEFQNQGAKKNQIEFARIDFFKLTIISPDNGDFTFLDSIKFFVEAENLPRQVVARGSGFQPGQIEVNLEIPSVKLKSYIVAPSMTFSSEVTGNRPENETTIEAHIRVFIEADISGSIGGGASKKHGQPN